MKVDTFQCDVCKTQKGALNHWFKFRSYLDEGNGAEFIVTDWKQQGIDYPNTKHLCSDACVIKTVQGWLSEQKELSQKTVPEGYEAGILRYEKEIYQGETNVG